MAYLCITGWLLAVQIMMTLVLILTVVVCLLSLLGIVGFCPPNRGATAQLTNSILIFGAGMLYHNLDSNIGQGICTYFFHSLECLIAKLVMCKVPIFLASLVAEQA